MSFRIVLLTKWSHFESIFSIENIKKLAGQAGVANAGYVPACAPGYGFTKNRFHRDSNLGLQTKSLES